MYRSLGCSRLLCVGLCPPCFDEPLAPSIRRRVQRRPVVRLPLGSPSHLCWPGALCCSAQQWPLFSLTVSLALALACLPATVHSLQSHRVTSCTQHAPHANHTHRLHLHATHTTRRAPHTHCTYHTLTIHDITHTSTHHTQPSPPISLHYRSCLSTQVWDGVQFTVCLGCTLCLLIKFDLFD